jgi:hypothetical protein
MTLSRRALLGGSLATLGLGRLVRLAHSQVPRAPTRLLIIHKPNGTWPASYDCIGGTTDFTLSPILEPFADVRQHMTILDGLDILKKPNTPGEDHGNAMVTFTTGGITYRANASANPLAERASIDQLLAREPAVVGDAPVQSLQRAADARSAALFTRILSYAGRGAPVPSVQYPQAAFARLFGSLAMPGTSPEQLAALRARKESVLDFAAADLARLERRLVGSERERIGVHLEAIRELERLFDRSRGCIDEGALIDQVVAVDPDQHDRQHAALGRAHFEIIRAAFRCDLTRVVTFGWASGQSHVDFSLIIPGVENLAFHEITHFGKNPEHDETAVHRWYNEQMAAMVRMFRDTPDLDGRSLLDNMLIVVWSEIRVGTHPDPAIRWGGWSARWQSAAALRQPPDQRSMAHDRQRARTPDGLVRRSRALHGPTAGSVRVRLDPRTLAAPHG